MATRYPFCAPRKSLIRLVELEAVLVCEQRTAGVAPAVEGAVNNKEETTRRESYAFDVAIAVPDAPKFAIGSPALVANRETNCVVAWLHTWQRSDHNT